MTPAQETHLENELKNRIKPVLDHGRVAWADYAKGICIFFVVMMHATLGVEKAADAEGWMHYATAFAKPFRMPDFFMISGLFLALTINKPWLRYIDRKVVHFAYFYLLWLTIIIVFKTPGWLNEGESASGIFGFYLYSFVEPFGTLWFIYQLPIFFIVTRLLKGLPALLLLGWAAILEILPIHVGSVVIDEFASRYFYFLIGYMFAPKIFDLARWAGENLTKGFALLALWAVVNAALVFAPVSFLPQWVLDMHHFKHLSDLPIISLLLGLAGAIAIVVSASLLTKFSWTKFLGFLGANSIVVYLAFTFPNSILRAILLKFATPFMDIGTISITVTLVSIAVPLIGYLVIKRTGYGLFLFERPSWARIEKAEKEARRTGDKSAPKQPSSTRILPAE